MPRSWKLNRLELSLARRTTMSMILKCKTLDSQLAAENLAWFIHQDWLLTPQRMAVHVPTKTAVLADMHLGYGEARRRAGDAVPEPDWHSIKKNLSVTFGRYDIRRLAFAGDLVEDPRSSQQALEFLSWLSSSQMELVGIAPGNHDRRGKIGWLESLNIPT